MTEHASTGWTAGALETEPVPDVVEEGRVSGPWWSSRAFLAVVIPPMLFLVLQPERFSVTPNPLDPYFYTGYAINFDDMLAATRDTHYFVTRWSVYMPARLFSAVAGPEWGRLLLRWVVATCALTSLWRLGRRWSWSRPTEVVVGVAVLASPMFARAFMTDYVEWAVVGLGIIFVCEALRDDLGVVRSAVLGVVGALLVTANPLALTITVAPSVIAVMRTIRVAGGRTTLRVLAAAAAAFTLTVVAAVLFFRLAYDIPNVYGPTWRFFRENAGLADARKSPKLLWLNAFTWLYSPLVIIATALGVPSLRRRLVGPSSIGAPIVVVATQYAVQWFDQFGRGGPGLEIAYYWSFAYPSIAVSLAVLLGTHRWSVRGAGGFIALFGACVVAPYLTDVRLPSAVVFGIVAAVVLVIVARLRPPEASPLPAVIVALLVLASQTLPPDYDTSSYHPAETDPRYDEVFFASGAQSSADLDTTIWFADQMDRIDDAGVFFVAGDTATAIIGIYGPHINGRWLHTAPDGLLDRATLDRVARGEIPLVAILGPPSFVDAVGHQLRDLSAPAEPPATLLDVVESGGRGFGLLVLDPVDGIAGPVTWAAPMLHAETGTLDGDVREANEGVDGAGFLGFGQFVELADQSYEVAITYSSSMSVGDVAGLADAAHAGVSEVSVPLPGTDGRSSVVRFVVDGRGVTGWEFRAQWAGLGSFRLESISVAPHAAGDDGRG